MNNVLIIIKKIIAYFKMKTIKKNKFKDAQYVKWKLKGKETQIMLGSKIQ